MSRALPESIAQIIQKHRDGHIEDCASCSAACCFYGGYAVLDNVLLAYEVYREKELKRDDYHFLKGLSFKAFIGLYFDIITLDLPECNIMLFRTRCLTKDNQIVVSNGKNVTIHDVPEVSEPLESKGCVFLSKGMDGMVDDGDVSRECLLHTSDIYKSTTSKPIQCVLFACADTYMVKSLDETASASVWMKALARAYPNSMERFTRAVMPNGTDHELTNARENNAI